MLTGAAVALFALIVPLGLVAIEGKPKPPKPAAQPASKARPPVTQTFELMLRLPLAGLGVCPRSDAVRGIGF